MRLTNFINESYDEYDHAEMVDTLLRTCMPYLKDRKFDQHLPDQQLYSGRSNDDDFFENTIRTNREPKDTPGWLHNELDDMFYKKFGVRARSNTLFTSGSRGQAMSYGDDVFIIFPKGPYTVIWSDEVDDLYIHIKHIYTDAIGIQYHYFDSGIENMLEHSEDIRYDMQDYVESQANEEYKRYYGEDTKGGIWTYIFDHYSPEELEKMGVKKGNKRDVFIKGFSKEKVKDMLHDKYGSLFPDNLVWSPDISLEDFTNKNTDKYEKEYITNRVKDIQHDIDMGMKYFINTYNKGDIQGAMESKSEVMLSSTHGYCALMDRKDNRDPIFHFFKEYGYHHPEDIKKRIGQEKWEHFKKLVRFESSI